MSRAERCFRWVSIVLMFAFSSSLIADDGQVLRLLNDLDSLNQETRILAVRQIYKSEIRDRKLLEQLNQLFIERYPIAKTPDDINELAWIAKALSISGDPAYLKTLKLGLESDDDKLRKYADEGIKRLKTFEKNYRFTTNTRHYSEVVYFYSLMLSSTSEQARTGARTYLQLAGLLEDEENDLPVITEETAQEEKIRIIEALRGEDREQAKKAAYRVFYGAVYDAEIFEQLKNSLERFLKEGDAYSTSEEELSWYVKALSVSGDLRYMPLIEKVRDAGKGKLIFYGKRSIMLLQEFHDWYQLIADVNGTKDPKAFYMAIMDIPYPRLKYAGAKYLISNRYFEDEEVQALAFHEISVFYPYIRRQKDEIAAASLLMRLLAVSGDTRYLSIITDVESMAPSEHLREHAQKNKNILFKAAERATKKQS